MYNNDCPAFVAVLVIVIFVVMLPVCFGLILHIYLVYSRADWQIATCM